MIVTWILSTYIVSFIFASQELCCSMVLNIQGHLASNRNSVQSLHNKDIQNMHKYSISLWDVTWIWHTFRKLQTWASPVWHWVKHGFLYYIWVCYYINFLTIMIQNTYQSRFRSCIINNWFDRTNCKCRCRIRHYTAVENSSVIFRFESHHPPLYQLLQAFYRLPSMQDHLKR